MKSTLLAIFGWAFALSLVPSFAFAQTGTAAPTSADDCPTGVVCLYNPLGTDEESYDIRKILGRVIRGILSIVGTVAFLMFVYGGTLWLTSAGNPERIKKGKDILIWAVAGLGIIFSAYAIVNAILNAITSGSVTGA